METGFISILGQSFVEIQQNATDNRPGSKLSWVCPCGKFRERSITDTHFPGWHPAVCNTCLTRTEQFEDRFEFSRTRGAASAKLKSNCSSVLIGAARFTQRAKRECL